MKPETCQFSGLRIHPGHGMRVVRPDSRLYIFLNNKAKSCVQHGLKPREVAWTQFYRRVHKKGQTEESSRKRVRKTAKVERSIVGAALDVIRAKRARPESDRAAAREKALRELKEKKKAKAAEKKAAPKKAKAAAPKGKNAPAGKSAGKQAKNKGGR